MLIKVKRHSKMSPIMIGMLKPSQVRKPKGGPQNQELFEKDCVSSAFPPNICQKSGFWEPLMLRTSLVQTEGQVKVEGCWQRL